jgi:hypothetical protein
MKTLGRLRRWWGLTPQNLAGLALGDDAWRWVSGTQVACEMLQPGWVVNGAVMAFEPVSAALQNLLDRLGPGSGPSQTRVAMCLPSSAVLLHRARLPRHLGERELLALCRQQANDWLPLPLAEMALDVYWDVQDEDEGASEGWAWVAATRLERVEQAVLLAQSAGLTLCVLETESCAFRRAVLRSQSNAVMSLQETHALALCLLSEEATQVQFLHLRGSHCGVLEERSLAWGRRHWMAPRCSGEGGAWLLPEVLEAVLMSFMSDQGEASGPSNLSAWSGIYLSGRLPPWLLAEETKVGWGGLPVKVFDPLPLGGAMESTLFSVACGLVQPVRCVPIGR